MFTSSMNMLLSRHSTCDEKQESRIEAYVEVLSMTMGHSMKLPINTPVKLIFAVRELKGRGSLQSTSVPLAREAKDWVNSWRMNRLIKSPMTIVKLGRTAP